MRRLKNFMTVLLPILILCFFTFGFLIAPNDPAYVNMSIRFSPPSTTYPLGTDNLGRCVFSRILYGGRTTLGIILIGSILIITLGIVLGLPIGSSKGKLKLALESLLNAVTAIPPIAYLIIFISVMGNGVSTMLIAVVLSNFLRMVKLVKTRTEVELEKAYVLSAITSGSGKIYILFVDILPNLLWDIMHYILLSAADMVITIVSFSFIGLGMGDDIIDWGIMISDLHRFIISNPSLTFYPVIAIIICALSFNILGRKLEQEVTE